MSQPHGSLRGIIGALRITSIASLITIALGVGTNKVLAVVAGTEGVALIGLYRSLGGIVTSVVHLGLTDRTIHRLSTAPDDPQRRQVVGAAVTLFAIQAVAILVLALVASGPIATLMFGAGEAASHVWQVRLVLATTTGVLALQLVTAALNGLALLRQSTWVAIVTSASTFATVYPLLLLGHLGLALVIGGTCYIGAALGIVYVVRDPRVGAAAFAALPGWRQALRVLPLSSSLIAEPLVVTGTVLVVQSLLARRLGTESLGLYNAASLMEGVAVMVLTASMRSYVLPTLGKFERDEDKQRFLNRVLLLLNFLVIVGVAVVVFAAPLAMRILFSGRFVAASKITSILCVSILSQMIGWCYAMFLLHRAEFATRLWIELAWGILRIAGTWYCLARAWPLASVAWVHVGAYALMAAASSVVVMVRYGRGMLSPINMLVAVAGHAALIALVVWTP